MDRVAFKIRLFVLMSLIFLVTFATPVFATAKTFYFHKEDRSSISGNNWNLTESATFHGSDTSTSSQTPTSNNQHVRMSPGTENSSWITGAVPTTVAGEGWWSDTKYKGTFAQGTWYFNLTSNDFDSSTVGNPVINLFRVPQDTSTSSATLLFQLDGSSVDWWTGNSGSVSVNKAGTGPFTLNNEYLLVEIYDNVTTDGTGEIQVNSFNVEVIDSNISTPSFVTWESYNDATFTTVDDDFTGSENTVYMNGTGFTASTSYKIAYYDGSNSKIRTVSKAADGSGLLNDSYTFQGNSTGTWHASVYPNSVTPPTTYEATNSNLLADDNFDVSEPPIPEFPMGSSLALVTSSIVYAFMRKKTGNEKE